MPFPSTSIATSYLMTIYVPLEAPKTISSELVIHNCRPGGWVRGPGIQGTVIAPTADWLRVMPNGVQRLDVRLTILADDDTYIFMSYFGRIVSAEQRTLRPRPGMSAPNSRYFITNPVFETDSRKYGWLNDLATVGKIVPSPEMEVTYDIFAID